MSSQKRFKVCLLGEGRVGKTSIMLRFVRNQYDDKQASTLRASYLEKPVKVKGQNVKVSIWDTAGQERFHALGPLYYRDADGALLVYDITDEASFQRVRNWVKELRKMLGNNIVITIAGNKCDLEKQRHVDRDTALKYASSVGANHFLTSAKTAEGLEEAFQDLITRVIDQKGGSSGPSSSTFGGGGGGGSLTFEDDPAPRKKGGCCK